MGAIVTSEGEHHAGAATPGLSRDPVYPTEGLR